MDLNWYEVTTTLIIMALLVLWFRAGVMAGQLIQENNELKVDIAAGAAIEEMYRTEKYKDHGEDGEKSFKEFSRKTMMIIKEKHGIAGAMLVRCDSKDSKEEASNA